MQYFRVRPRCTWGVVRVYEQLNNIPPFPSQSNVLLRGLGQDSHNQTPCSQRDAGTERRLLWPPLQTLPQWFWGWWPLSVPGGALQRWRVGQTEGCFVKDGRAGTSPSYYRWIQYQVKLKGAHWGEGGKQSIHSFINVRKPIAQWQWGANFLCICWLFHTENAIRLYLQQFPSIRAR